MYKSKTSRVLKMYSLALLVFFSLTFTAAAFAVPANNCGSGKITAIKEGGWDTNHLMIKIDYSISQPLDTHVGTTWYSWIRYKKELNEKRFSGIRALTYIAFGRGANVEVFSHTGRCDNATEFTII